MKNNFYLTFKKTKGLGSNINFSLKNIIGINKKKEKFFFTPLSYGKVYIRSKLKQYKIDNLLNTILYKRIQNYISNKSYKGMRFRFKYPVRGQRTHTNAKTQRKLMKLYKLV